MGKGAVYVSNEQPILLQISNVDCAVASTWYQLPNIPCHEIELYQTTANVSVAFSSTPGNNVLISSPNAAPMRIKGLTNANQLWVEASVAAFVGLACYTYQKIA